MNRIASLAILFLSITVLAQDASAQVTRRVCIDGHAVHVSSSLPSYLPTGSTLYLVNPVPKGLYVKAGGEWKKIPRSGYKVRPYFFPCSAPAFAHAQGQTPPKAVVPPAPAIKAEDLLKLRNLTHEQNKRTITMRDAQIAFDKARAEHDKLQEFIQSWVVDQATAQKVDLTTHYFDLDELKFKERKPEPKKAN